MTEASAGKTLEAMRANPLDSRIDDLKKVAKAFGVNVRETGGRHVYFTHAHVREGSACRQRPIKPVYIRAFVRFVDRVREL
jgi:hypothetical protein